MMAEAWSLHDDVGLREGDGTIDFDDDTFAVRLYASGSNVSNTSISDATTVTDELPTAGGYTNGGQTVAVTWTQSAPGTVLLASIPPLWIGSGAGFSMRYAALVDTSVSPHFLVAHTMLDDMDIFIGEGIHFVVNTVRGVFQKT